MTNRDELLRLCDVDGCDNKHLARGFCKKHYQRLTAHGDPLFIKYHNLSGHSLYPTWKGMMDRCHNEKSRYYKDYGGRGIVVCDRWKNVKNFVADMGEKPDGLSLDRIDNDGDYAPGNVRWATATTQNRNSRQCKLNEESVLRIVSLRESGLSLSEIADEIGVSFQLVSGVANGERWSDVTGIRAKAQETKDEA